MSWSHFLLLQKEDVPAQLLESVSEDEGSGIALAPEIGTGTVAGVAHGLLTGDAQGEFLFVFVFAFRETLFSRVIFAPHSILDTLPMQSCDRFWSEWVLFPVYYHREVLCFKWVVVHLWFSFVNKLFVKILLNKPRATQSPLFALIRCDNPSCSHHCAPFAGLPDVIDPPPSLLRDKRRDEMMSAKTQRKRWQSPFRSQVSDIIYTLAH